MSHRDSPGRYVGQKRNSILQLAHTHADVLTGLLWQVAALPSQSSKAPDSWASYVCWPLSPRLPRQRQQELTCVLVPPWKQTCGVWGSSLPWVAPTVHLFSLLNCLACGHQVPYLMQKSLTEPQLLKSNPCNNYISIHLTTIHVSSIYVVINLSTFFFFSFLFLLSFPPSIHLLSTLYQLFSII